MSHGTGALCANSQMPLPGSVSVSESGCKVCPVNRVHGPNEYRCTARKQLRCHCRGLTVLTKNCEPPELGRPVLALGQGLTLAHFRAQLEDLRDTSLTPELNLSTFGRHQRVNLGYMGDKVSSS